MKFFINKENLLFAIQSVQRAVSQKSPLPILTGIKFSCEEDKLVLSATDFEISVRCAVPATVEESGSLVIPAKYITEFARRLPDSIIEFEAVPDSTMAVIRYSDSEFNINGYDASEFPSFVIPEEEFSFKLDADLFKEIIKQVTFAVSTEESRPVFTGVLFEIVASRLTIVATDTFRLALRHTAINEETPELINVIVPGKTLNELARTADPKSIVEVIIGKTHAAFITGETQIIARLIPGKFPSYRQVIPNQFISEIKISLKDFLESAERVALLAGENNLLVSLYIRENHVVLNMRSETGWIREEIKSEVNGDKLEISFNVRYLCDVLRSINYEQLVVRLTGPLTPALIIPEDNKDYLSILVPARLSRE